MKTLNHSLVISLLLLISTAHVFADSNHCTNVKEVAAGVYVRQGQHGIAFTDTHLANIGFVIGQQCVAVVDSGGSPQEGRELKCAIAKTTDVPVCYVIITHHHFDHVLGNIAFKNATDQSNQAKPVEIIAHKKMELSLQNSASYYLEQMQSLLGDEATPEIIVTPDRTVDIGQPLQLDLGNRVLQLTAHPTAHTNNDLSVLDQQTGTIWLGDLLFVDHIPTLEGSINGWLDVLSTIMNEPATQAVPGHGPVDVPWPAGGEPEQRYFTTVRDEVRQLIEEGADIEQARDNVGQSEASHWQNFDLHHKRNVIRAYTELEWE